MATILSAQCTDQRVNEVTPALFRKYPDAAHYAAAPAELEKEIQSTGFFRNKAKTSRPPAECRRAVRRADSPDIDESATARRRPKTANVVLGTAFQSRLESSSTRMWRG